MSLVADVRIVSGPLDIDVSLRAATGETVVVLGPNGAGKTSLLRALAGLHALERGVVSLSGYTVDDPVAGIWIPPERRRVAVAFQQGLLFPHLSVLENVAFGLRAAGTQRDEARSQARRWLGWVELDDRATATPAELSGGEAQRVGLARALAIDADLLLLDEPFAALDVGARDRFRTRLSTLLAERGCTTVVVTHDPLDAMSLANRLVVLEAGAVVQAGTPAEVNRAPATAFVAQLVGLNLVAGVASGHQVLVESGTALVTPESHEGPVTVAFAPHAVLLHRERPAGSARNAWRASVAGINRSTDRARVQLGDPVPCVAEITVDALHDLDLGTGQEVWASVKATELDVHPGATATRPP